MSGAISMIVAVQQYLEERRQLGFDLIAPGTELMRFARFADARDHRGPLTQALIVGWAREHVKRTSVVTAARRLEIVRPFAAYYRQFEPATEVPPLGILGRGHRRLAPHIYTDEELMQLLRATIASPRKTVFGRWPIARCSASSQRRDCVCPRR